MTMVDAFERDVHDTASLYAFLSRSGWEATEAVHVVSKTADGRVTVLAEVLPDQPRSASVVVLPA